MKGRCPDCGTPFEAQTPPALVDLVLAHRCEPEPATLEQARILLADVKPVTDRIRQGRR